MNKKTTGWTLYILKCGDGSLYTGVTNDLEKRFLAHQQGTGAKYTRGRGPLEIIHQEHFPDRSTAQKREYAVKAMKRADKLTLSEKSTAR